MAFNIASGPVFHPNTLVSEVHLHNDGLPGWVSVTFVGLIEPNSGPEIGAATGFLWNGETVSLTSPFSGPGIFFYVPGYPVRCSIY